MQGKRKKALQAYATPFALAQPHMTAAFGAVFCRSTARSTWPRWLRSWLSMQGPTAAQSWAASRLDAARRGAQEAHRAASTAPGATSVG